MSNSLTINANQTPIANIQANSVLNNPAPQFKMAGLDKEDTSSGIKSEISNEGKAKLENTPVNTISNAKKAGVTAAREAWENNSAKLKKEARYSSTSDTWDIQELFRLDDPDTYARARELHNRAFDLLIKKNYDLHIASQPADYEPPAYDKIDIRDIEVSADNAVELQFQEAKTLQFSKQPINDRSQTLKSDPTINALFAEASSLEWDWFQRRCMKTGSLKNPVFGQYSDIDALEAKYSTDGHDTRFNYYTSADSNLREDSLWRYCAKFNVLLDARDVKNLDDELLEKIDKAVKEMKEAEKAYEGNLTYLQFGAKLWDDGRVTYHARYEGCGSEDGIMADSADELLKMLMGK